MYEINLVKGEEINLEKECKLDSVTLGLGWKVSCVSGFDFDLDASALLLSNNKLIDKRDFVFYNNLKCSGGEIVHTGDNLVGGDGFNDDEQIIVKLGDLPKRYDRIIFVVNIYRANQRKQNFGQVSDAYIRVFNNNNFELARYELAEEFSKTTGVIFAELYKDKKEWKFKAIGKEFSGDLGSLINSYT